MRRSIEPWDSDVRHGKRPSRPGREEAARLQQIAALTNLVVRRRKEAVEGRQQCGIETIWREDGDQYNGIDDNNRAELSKEPGQSTESAGPTRSTVFLNITQPKTDAAEARVIDMMLPVDNKPWGLVPTPIPELANMARTKPRHLCCRTASKCRRPMWPNWRWSRRRPQPKRWKRKLTINSLIVIGRSQTRAMIRSAARLGTGVMKGPFPKMLQERSWLPMEGQESVYQLTIIERMAPWCACVDVWDFFPDPNCGDDVQAGSYVIERDYLTARKLRELAKDPSYYADEIAGHCAKAQPDQSQQRPKRATGRRARRP